PELKSAKDLLVSQSEDLARKNPQLAYDLSVMFMFMESYSEALKMLAFAMPSSESQWLRLELLLKAREFVLALDEADRMEMTYSTDPESTFAATYARARALRGLGQTAQAVELIRSIVSVRPNYKSARSLLMDWG